MKFRALLFLTFTFVVSDTHSQNVRFDSLINVNAQYIKDDSEKLRRMNELTFVYCSMQTDTAILLARQSIALANKINDRKGLGVAMFNSAFAASSNGKIIEAIELYKLAIAENKRHNNSRILGLCYLNLGNCLYSKIESDSLNYYYDSAMRYFKSANDSTGIFLTMLWSSSPYFYDDNEKARQLLHASIEGFTKLGDNDNKAYALSYLASLNNYMSHNDSALFYFQKALDLAIHNNNRTVLIYIYAGMGFLYSTQADYIQAIKYDLLALRYCEATGNNSLKANALNNLAWMFREVGDYEKAIENLDKQLLISKIINDNYNLAGAYQEYALIYIAQKKFSEALAETRKMNQIALKIKRDDRLVDTYNLFGQSFEGLQQYDSAIYYYNRAVEMSNKINSPYYKAQNLTGLARTINAAPDKLILGELRNIVDPAEKTERAIVYAESAYSLSKENHEIALQRNAAKLLSVLYEQQNNTPKALDYYKTFTLLNDTILNVEKTKAIAGLQFKFEDEKKDREIVLLKAQQEVDQLKSSRQIGINYGLGGALAGIIFVALAFYKQNHKTKKINNKLEIAYDDLKNTQGQLVKSEKLAAFGIMASRVAHEIQNPLNFVNNFADISQEIVQDFLNAPDEIMKSEAAKTLTENLRKINHHGNRANNIVKQLLDHTRAGTAHEFFEGDKTI